MELAIRPAERNALLTSPNVRGVVRVVRCHIRVRAKSRQLHLRGTRQAVQRHRHIVARHTAMPGHRRRIRQNITLSKPLLSSLQLILTRQLQRNILDSKLLHRLASTILTGGDLLQDQTISARIAQLLINRQIQLHPAILDAISGNRLLEHRLTGQTPLLINVLHRETVRPFTRCREPGSARRKQVRPRVRVQPHRPKVQRGPRRVLLGRMHRQELRNIIQHRTRRIFHAGVRQPVPIHTNKVELARLQRTRRNLQLRTEIVIAEPPGVNPVVRVVIPLSEHRLTHHLSRCRVSLIDSDDRPIITNHFTSLGEDMASLNPQRRILPRVIDSGLTEGVGSTGRLRFLNHINMGASIQTVRPTRRFRLSFIRRVVRHHHIEELTVGSLNVLRGNLKRVGEATVRVLPHLMHQILEHSAVLVERLITIVLRIHVHRPALHQSQLVESVLLTELSAQRGSRHRHRAALRNIEGSRSHLQLNIPRVLRINSISGKRRHRKLRAHRELMATVRILRVREHRPHFSH